MSSPHSLQPAPGADGAAAIAAAALHVVEASLFACAEPCDPARFAALLRGRAADEPWLTASIGFSGPFDGAAQLALPRAVAADLAGAFCGTPPGALDAEPIADFTGELANMICGHWLTGTHRADRFDLAAPLVTESAAAAVARTLDAAPVAVRLSLDGAPVLIVLASRPRGSAGAP